MQSVGSRLQVFAGIAQQTSGGLKKSALAKNKYGKIVSKKKQGQKSNLKGFLAGVGGKPKAAPKKAKPPAPKKAKPPAPPKQAQKAKAAPAQRAKPKPKPKPAPAPAPTRRSTRVRKKTQKYGF